MRVLEGEITVSYSMGKKNKRKLQKHCENEISDSSDSSEDVNAKGCAHVHKAINFGAMKKGLAKQTLGECAGCAKKGESTSLIDRLEGATSEDFCDAGDPCLWVCLQCGHQGCGRLSPEMHALKHHETPHSSFHNVVINTSNWLVWCYDCDCEIPASKSKKVAECLEFLQKQVTGLAGH